jgi:hypothetical protein
VVALARDHTVFLVSYVSRYGAICWIVAYPAVGTLCEITSLNEANETWHTVPVKEREDDAAAPFVLAITYVSQIR